MERLHSSVVLLQSRQLFLHLESNYVFCKKISVTLKPQQLLYFHFGYDHVRFISYIDGSLQTARPSFNIWVIIAGYEFHFTKEGYQSGERINKAGLTNIVLRSLGFSSLDV